ncbi:MAG: preprotein translocase subunit YajC [Lachnospiraceae bacterium]|nr:preprotein translocase subunit YajC [Lachnospiraceae bacterium]
MGLDLLLTATGNGVPAGGTGSIFGSYGISLVLMIVIFYFFLIRPQKKEQKKIQDMLKEVEVGDVVVTTSGFYGVVIDVTDDDVIVEFGSNRNCRIPMKKSAIAQVEKADDGSSSSSTVEEKKEDEGKKSLFGKKKD